MHKLTFFLSILLFCSGCDLLKNTDSANVEKNNTPPKGLIESQENAIIIQHLPKGRMATYATRTEGTYKREASNGSLKIIGQRLLLGCENNPDTSTVAYSENQTQRILKQMFDHGGADYVEQDPRIVTPPLFFAPMKTPVIFIAKTGKAQPSNTEHTMPYIIDNEASGYLFPIMPTGEIEVGSRWSEEVPLMLKGIPGNNPFNAMLESQFIGWRNVDGKKLAVVDYTLKGNSTAIIDNGTLAQEVSLKGRACFDVENQILFEKEETLSTAMSIKATIIKDDKEQTVDKKTTTNTKFIMRLLELRDAKEKEDVFQ